MESVRTLDFMRNDVLVVPEFYGPFRVIYRHVDLLNEMGVHAAVLHTRANLDFAWFSHATRVESVRTLDFMRNDVLVVPEFYGPF
ncbi:hypothetical protein CTI14_63460, partial [Methylobacterium radiotolerans]